MLIEAAETSGAMASKKNRCSSPLSAAMADERAGEVSGPLAMMTGESGISVSSSRTISIRGCDETRVVTSSEKASRSTARAPPAGREVCWAQWRSMEPRRRNSSLRTPEARSGRFDPREFEQTSSARPPVRCAPVICKGRIS
jgi:hypothetical protein